MYRLSQVYNTKTDKGETVTGLYALICRLFTKDGNETLKHAQFKTRHITTILQEKDTIMRG
jgi:hypothetical protein